MRPIILPILTTLYSVGYAQVQNPGFENGLAGWDTACDCAPIQLTGDVPPGGGSSSLAVGVVDLDCICTATDAVHQPIPWLFPGQWVLSAWIKSADAGNVPGAAVRISEGPAFSSAIVADAWSFAGEWTFVADTFLLTSITDFASLAVSLIPDDGNMMSPDLFASFDQVMIDPILSTSISDPEHVWLQVFPDPAREVISFVQKAPVIGIVLFDATGRTTSAVPFWRYGDRVTLDLSGIPPGPWLLKVTTDRGMHTARFVKT